MSTNSFILARKKVLYNICKISEAMRDRDYHHRKAVKAGSPYHWRMFRKLRNFVNEEIKRSKSNYYIGLIEDSKGESSKLWKAVNEVSSRKNKTSTPNCIISDGVQHTDVRSIASVLNKHFASIGQLLADKLTAFAVAVTPDSLVSSDACFRLQPIDELFTVTQLKSLRTNKAIGLDRISARLLKDAAVAISPSVTKLLNSGPR